MGNTVATGVGRNVTSVVDMKDLNPKVTTIGPLGRRRGRLFTSLHCRYTEDKRDVVARVLQRVPDDTEQSEIIKRQELAFNALDNRIRGARATSREEAQPQWSYAPLHLLHYTTTKTTESTVYMERVFVQYSLPERLQARPFLGENRRLFIVYQLFAALHELHAEYGISHGDLKAENVLISSCGWLYLADVAPYKPQFLESWNPANFECYFDVAERRVCTLPPERFVDETEAAVPPVTTNVANGSPSTFAIPETMEVFSAACVAAFVFTDEHPFKLPNVLELRKRATHQERRAYVLDALSQSSTTKMRDEIKEFIVFCLIGHPPNDDDHQGPSTTDPIPYNRPTAREAIERFTPQVFPRYFGMLHRNVIPTLLSLPPDMQIQFVSAHLEHILDAAVRCEWDAPFARSMSQTADEAREARKQTAAVPEELPPKTSPGPPMSDSDKQQIQSDVLDIIVPIVTLAVRFAVLEDSLLRAFFLIANIASRCTEECRRDLFIPLLVNIVRAERSSITPVVRAFALRALATVSACIRCLPPSECFLFEEYILPAVYGAAKLGAKSAIVACELPGALCKVLNAAMYIVEERQGLGNAYRSRLNFDAQREAVVGHGWEMLRPSYSHANCSVVCAALAEVKSLLPLLGVAIVSESLLPLLTTHLGHPAVEVRRAMVAAALEVAYYLRHPSGNASATIVLILEEALREKDASCTFIALTGLQKIIESEILTSRETIQLVHHAIALMAHPSEWVAKASSRLVATAVKCMDPVDVMIQLVQPLRALLREPIPAVFLDRFSPRQFVREEALQAMSDARRRIPSGASYHRQYAHPGTVTIPAPPAVPLRDVQSADSANGVGLVDFTFSEVLKIIKTLGLEQAIASIPSKQKVHVPFHVPVADGPFHVSDFVPTPRQLKRLVWRYRYHRKTVASTGIQKVKRSFNIKDSDHAPPTNNAPALLHVVSAAQSHRSAPRPIGIPLLKDAQAHRGSITSLASARHWIVSSGTDGTVKLWDLTDSLKPNGTRLTIPQTFKDVLDPAVSGGGTILFAHFLSDDPHSLVSVGSSTGSLQFIDIGSGKAPISTRIGAGETCDGLSSCVSLDARVVVLGSYSGGLYAVDSRTPSREVWSSSLPRARGPISKLLTVAPDAPFGILCSTMRGFLSLIDMRFRSSLASVVLPYSPCIYDMAAVQGPTENGAPNVAIVTSTSDIVRLDVSTFHETIQLKPAAVNTTRCIASAKGGSLAFTGGSDGVLRLWNFASPESSRTIVPPDYYSQDYNFNRGAQVIAEVPLSIPGTPRRLEADVDNSSNACHCDTITRLCSVLGSGSQEFLVSGARDGSLKVWRNLSTPSAA